MNSLIPFNKPYIAGKEMYYIAKAVLNGHSAGDGPFTKKCHALIEKKLGTLKALLTQSYEAALDMAAMLCDLKPGDEVIMPSFAFVSVANAFFMRGAVPVFVDIRHDTLNLDETLIIEAITARTRAIVAPHYAGVSVEMDIIMQIANSNNLLVIEDASRSFGIKYGDRHLGTIGDLGVLSFHETNSIMCGEGGALLVNNKNFIDRAEVIREKGTNRSRFFRGEVDKYTWVAIGSSFLPSDMLAAFLYAQLEMADQIIAKRGRLFNSYMQGLSKLAEKKIIQLPNVINLNNFNGNSMYLITRSKAEQRQLIRHLNAYNINALFHYVPLHTSPMGKKYGRVDSTMKQTVEMSTRLVRLPLFFEMTDEDVYRIVDMIRCFYNDKGECND